MHETWLNDVLSGRYDYLQAFEEHNGEESLRVVRGGRSKANNMK